MPRPHPKKGERDLVNLDRFLGLTGSVWARTDTVVVKQTMGHGGGCMHANDSNLYSRQWPCNPAVGKSYDYTKAAISLEHSNSFPWPKDCVQIHQTLFPPLRVGSGDKITVWIITFC